MCIRDRQSPLSANAHDSSAAVAAGRSARGARRLPPRPSRAPPMHPARLLRDDRTQCSATPSCWPLRHHSSGTPSARKGM
eukprot:10348319-Alexandrium_andersonii.AAC.1